MNYNKVQLAGNLTRDIELKYTQSNRAVANIGLAVNNRYKASDGTMKEETTFVDCEAWGATAETMSKYLSKGRPVFIDGRLKVETWDDKNTNQKRSKLKVVVESFQFIGPKPQDGYAASPDIEPRTTAATRQPAQARAARVEYEPSDEEGIPF